MLKHPSYQKSRYIKILKFKYEQYILTWPFNCLNFFAHFTAGGGYFTDEGGVEGEWVESVFEVSGEVSLDGIDAGD